MRIRPCACQHVAVLYIKHGLSIVTCFFRWCGGCGSKQPGLMNMLEAQYTDNIWRRCYLVSRSRSRSATDWCCKAFVSHRRACAQWGRVRQNQKGLTLVCKKANIRFFSPRGGCAAGGSAGRHWFARLASAFHHMRASGVSYK